MWCHRVKTVANQLPSKFAPRANSQRSFRFVRNAALFTAAVTTGAVVLPWMMMNKNENHPMWLKQWSPSSSSPCTLLAQEHQEQDNDQELLQSLPPVIRNNARAVQLIHQLESDPDFERVSLPPSPPKNELETASESESESARIRQYLLSKHQGTEQVKKFDYVCYFSKRLQKSVVLVYFGPHMEGPPGCSHGGSMATLVDAVMSANVWRCDMFALTANLSVNYRKFMPLESVVVCESNILAVNGRKVQAEAVLKSLDGSVHVDATGLWITVPPEKFYELLYQARQTLKNSNK